MRNKIIIPCQNCLIKPICLNKINWMSDCSIMMDWLLKGPDIAIRFHHARIVMGSGEEKRTSTKILEAYESSKKDKVNELR